MLNEIEKNPQIIYMDKRNAMGLAMNLLTFGYRQFVLTKRFEKLPLLKKLCEEFKPNQPPDFSNIHDLAFNSLLDSIKITLCFENFIKGLLISNGYMIHKLDRNAFKELSKEQFSKPISVRQVLDVRDWEMINSINLPEDWMKRQIKGISKQTIGMKELLSSEYLTLLKIPKSIIDLCNPYFQYRNKLHLYSGESISLSKSDYSDFVKIINFINTDLVRIQNLMVDQLKMDNKYKLPLISYS